ncbi:DnaD domain-containing protein [Neobacillus vireti]|uniref:DnaD domain-containing protein n=1 Tax=Neobacillus vireti TaxID=220686 RepID=UPI002FFF0B6D
MAKYRMVRSDFWKCPIVLEEMTPEDKYFYLYLLTNSNTTQIGIYKITKKQMAFDLGYSIEGVHALMERFINHHQVIRYNPETRELAIKNWGKENLHKAGKPVMDCILTELKDVEDHLLIQYVAETIQKQDIRSLYESFCGTKEIFSDKNEMVQDETDTYIEQENRELNDVLAFDEQEEQHPNSKNKPTIENTFQTNQENVKEIIEFWDSNGFGFNNLNAKQQLLSWLDDSSFLQPKDVILKALIIACASNKRRLNYVVGILKNWKNESLLTVEEIDSYQENQKPVSKNSQSTVSVPGGRPIPGKFVLDLTDGEE